MRVRGHAQNILRHHRPGTFELADEYLQFFDIDPGTCKSIFFQQVWRGLGLALHAVGAPKPNSAASGIPLRTPPFKSVSKQPECALDTPTKPQVRYK